ncbi:MAG: radical SAM protein, partial [Candidatus Omnitrophica bacterium]|nr:radical SAM protein [Candidatus Omnitrophota bacterium]
GEPMLKPGFLDLLEFTNKKGFRTFIVTNGFFIDETIAGRIVRSGVEGISISLDSLNEDTHDFLRGIKGAYKQAVQAINYLTKENAKGIAVLTIIMGHNLDGIVQIADWVESNNNISSIYFQAVSQPIATLKDEQWYEKDEFGYLWPQDKIQLDFVIDQLIARKNKGYKISNSVRQFEMFKAYFRQPDKLYEGMTCTQGDYVIYIRPTGDVLLCGTMAPIGNIRKTSIKEIWNSPEAALRRKQIHSCQESCLNVLNCFENKELP